MALPGSLKIHWHLHWLGNKCPLIVSPFLNLPPSLGYAGQGGEVATALRTQYSHFLVSSLSSSKFALRKIHYESFMHHCFTWMGRLGLMWKELSTSESGKEASSGKICSSFSCAFVVTYEHREHLTWSQASRAGLS